MYYYLSPKNLLAMGGIMVFSAGGFGIFAANEANKKTIRSVLGKKRIANHTIWKDDGKGVGDKLYEKYSLNSSKAKSKEFSELSLKENSYDSQNQLKEVCEESASKKYSDLFTINRSLLHDVDLFCSLSMKEMLDEEKLFDISKSFPNEEEKKIIKENLDQIKNSDGESNLQIIRIRESMKYLNVNDSNIKDLFLGCKRSYEEPYIVEKEDIFNLIKLNCIKDSKPRINSRFPGY